MGIVTNVVSMGIKIIMEIEVLSSTWKVEIK
jgi:hypothetical protein